MKSLKESIFDDVEDIVNDDTVLIEQFLKDNYEIDGTYIIDGSYDINRRSNYYCLSFSHSSFVGANAECH